MSLAERHITHLMRQIATQDVIELVHPFAELKTIGALVCVAECYGFRYTDVRLVGKHKVLHVYLTRDTSPGAQQRAAASAATFPQAGAGGAVPGLYPGTLDPVPEAEADVELITALIRYDALGVAANRKQLVFMSWSFPLLFLLLAVLTEKYAVLLPLAVLMPVLLLGSLRINATRRAKLAQRLTAAGCTLVRDEAGRERYVRPLPYAV